MLDSLLNCEKSCLVVMSYRPETCTTRYAHYPLGGPVPFFYSIDDVSMIGEHILPALIAFRGHHETEIEERHDTA